MGLFKPTWQNNNKEKALKAVAKERNPQELIAITLDAEDDVALAALDKIDNPALLVEFAKGDSFEVENKTGVSSKSISFKIRDAALSKLPDDLLMQVALSGSSGSNSAVKRISSQAMLRKIACSSPDYYIRATAIEKLTDKEVLQQLAETEDCTGVYASLSELVKRKFTFESGDDVDGWYYLNQLRKQAQKRLEQL